MSEWRNVQLPPRRIGLMGWLRVLVKGGLMGFVTYAGLAVLLLVRLIERPLCAQARPVTPYITQAVCRAVFFILRLRLVVRGTPMMEHGALVANHASWLDIFALNAATRMYFVAKSEVEGWAAIGWLARATGTVFIARKGSAARVQQRLFEERLRAGHRLLFFPEGTSTDAVRVLPFKSTLFQAFYTASVEVGLHIQPVTVIYHSPAGEDARFYGWWGDLDFAPHLLTVLAAPRHGRIEMVFHTPVAVSDFAGRKELAAYCEEVVRGAHPLLGV